MEPRGRSESVSSCCREVVANSGVSQKNPVYGSCCFWGEGRPLCVATEPKKHLSQSRYNPCKEGTENSLSPPPASPRFCQYGNVHTQVLLLNFLYPINLLLPIPTPCSGSSKSLPNIPFPKRDVSSHLHCCNARRRWSCSAYIPFLKKAFKDILVKVLSPSYIFRSDTSSFALRSYLW